MSEFQGGLATENAALRAQIQELNDEGISENHAIITLTGNPRPGYTLQQEIRAQLEEAQAEVEELKRERDSADNGVQRNAEKAAEYFKRAERAENQLAEAQSTIRQLRVLTEPMTLEEIAKTLYRKLHVGGSFDRLVEIRLALEAAVAQERARLREWATLVRAATASRAIEALRRPTPDPLEGTYESRYALGWNDALHRVLELLR